MLLTWMSQLNWSPLLLWSQSLKQRQEIHPGMVGWSKEERQGSPRRYQCFDQGGCLWAGHLETGVLESYFSPMDLLACQPQFSHL